MKLTLSLLFLILALVCFLLATFGVPKASWRDLGFAFLTAAYLAG